MEPLSGGRSFDNVLVSDHSSGRSGAGVTSPTKRGHSPPNQHKRSSGGSADSEGHHYLTGEAHHDHFKASHGLSTTEATRLLLKHGRNELEDKRTPKWLIFVHILLEPMPVMIWLAALVEAIIQNWLDMNILLAIQFLNASLSFYETTKAGDAVVALKASLKPLAYVKRDGIFRSIDAALLVPGDLVSLSAGGAVPADCIVNHGQIDVDQAALTGESLPITFSRGDSVKMGSTVVRGEVEATVEATGADTFFGKTARLINAGDEEVSNLQKVLMHIMTILVALSLTLSLIVLIYLLAHGEGLRESLSFTVILIVASIPVAIEIVCTTTLALGSHELSKEGAIVSRLAAIEDMAGMNILCSDKTGTLTLNKMVIQDETPVYAIGENQRTLLTHAAMAAKWKEPPRDALDTLVLNAVDMTTLKGVQQVDYLPFDPTVKRTEGTIRTSAAAPADGTTTTTTFKVTKGAPHVLLQLLSSKSKEEQDVIRRVKADVHRLGQRGVRSLAVAKTDKAGQWRMLGLLTFLDPPRPDTRATIERSASYGVEVKMVTGDHLLIAKETARMLGMGLLIHDSTGLPVLDSKGNPPEDLIDFGPMIREADGFAHVYPEHKYLIVECLRRMHYKVGMTGDGVNDAPALKRADVGVAVQGATDAARASADIILTEPGLSTIVTGIIISRVIFARMQNFITYRIAATLQLLVFFFFAVLCLHPRASLPSSLPPDFPDKAEDWPHFFKMPVLMLMLITLLNDGTLISIGYDTVKPNQLPDQWNLRRLFAQASVLGLVACVSSLLMLHAALDSWNPDGLFQQWGLGGLSYGQITTMVYLKVSISDFLTLFSARTPDGFFWSVPPSTLLLVAASCALLISTFFAIVWPVTYEDGILTEGLGQRPPRVLALYVWVYCLLCWLVQDLAKVMVAKVLNRLPGFGGKVGTSTAAGLMLSPGLGSRLEAQGSSNSSFGDGEDMDEEINSVTTTSNSIKRKQQTPLARRSSKTKQVGSSLA